MLEHTDGVMELTMKKNSFAAEPGQVIMAFPNVRSSTDEQNCYRKIGDLVSKQGIHFVGWEVKH